MGTINLSGQKFGQLLVIRQSGVDKHHNKLYLCLCSCGREKVISNKSLRHGGTKSCGCLSKISNLKHGLYKHPLRSVWSNMKYRCCNINCKEFQYYGGRGITVCEEWQSDFKIFYDWAISNGWEKGLQIDRINNDGNYAPQNCHFVTPRENISNRGQSLNRNLPIGVTKRGKRFRADIRINNKLIYLGTFDTQEEAHQAYLNAIPQE